jgi:ubiquinol oxidase
LPQNTRLRDVVIAVRADEAEHRNVNHGFAGQLIHSHPVALAVE